MTVDQTTTFSKDILRSRRGILKAVDSDDEKHIKYNTFFTCKKNNEQSFYCETSNNLFL